MLRVLLVLVTGILMLLLSTLENLYAASCPRALGLHQETQARDSGRHLPLPLPDVHVCCCNCCCGCCRPTLRCYEREDEDVETPHPPAHVANGLNAKPRNALPLPLPCPLLQNVVYQSSRMPPRTAAATARPSTERPRRAGRS